MTTNDDRCTATPRRPLAPCPLTVRDRNGRTHVLQGRTWGGLGLHVPYEVVRGRAQEVRQVRGHEHWCLTHLESGLAIGWVRGTMTAAWQAMVRLAAAADWERPRLAVLGDPDCLRLARMLSTLPRPRAEEVLP